MSLTDAITRGRAAMQATLMRDTYQIVRTTRVSDGGGGWTEGTPTILTGICALIIIPRVQFEQSGAQVQQRGHFRLSVPIADNQIRPGDVLTINGRQLRVTWNPPVSDGMGLTRKIGLESVDQ